MFQGTILFRNQDGLVRYQLSAPNIMIYYEFKDFLQMAQCARNFQRHHFEKIDLQMNHKYCKIYCKRAKIGWKISIKNMFSSIKNYSGSSRILFGKLLICNNTEYKKAFKKALNN